MDFNLLIIPAVIIATAVVGSRYVQRGLKTWYQGLEKPSWTPPGKLIKEIWTFLYILTGLAVLWYWNVPIVAWLHYVVAVLLLINAYLNATWNRDFFVEQNLKKALSKFNLIIATAILATVLMAVHSPIAAGLMLPYIIWLLIARTLNKRILQLNPS